MQVLNLSFCSLSGTLDLAGLTSLRALILNDNALEAVTGALGSPWLSASTAMSCWPAASLQASRGGGRHSLVSACSGLCGKVQSTSDAPNNAMFGGTGLGRLPELNTLVLTRNRLASLRAAPLAGCSALAKLSLSHNALGDLEGAPAPPGH